MGSENNDSDKQYLIGSYACLEKARTGSVSVNLVTKQSSSIVVGDALYFAHLIWGGGGGGGGRYDKLIADSAMNCFFCTEVTLL